MLSDVQGFILVGGQSRRMGRDKAQLLLGQQTFIERLRETLAQITSEVFLVGESETCAALGLPTIPDVHPRCGALGGIYTALAHCRTPWAFVIACDLPLVTADLIRALALRRAHYEAVIPVQRGSQKQPLCAFYAREACLPAVRDLIDSGERRVGALTAKISVCLAPEESLPAAAHALLNVNTPAEYATARDLLEH